MKKGMFALAAFVLINSIAFADVPQWINFQARLTDNTGNPLPDNKPALPVVVSLYTVASGGTAVWSDIFQVQTKSGYFNIVLGKDGTAKPFTGVDFNNQLYAGISVNGDSEMIPRQALSSVPYAMNVADGAITNNKLVAGAVGTTTMADNSITITKIDPSLWQAILPIGTILAWHGSLQYTNGKPTPQSPPADFVECNGQTLNDPSSPYSGQVIPNLNGVSSGAGLPVAAGGTTITPVFLRGGTTSGIGQLDAFQGHNHNAASNLDTMVLFNNSGKADTGLAGGTNPIDIGKSTGGAVNGSSGNIRVSTETRPVNMSVIWIMKIQ